MSEIVEKIDVKFRKVTNKDLIIFNSVPILGVNYKPEFVYVTHKIGATIYHFICIGSDVRTGELLGVFDVVIAVPVVLNPDAHLVTIDPIVLNSLEGISIDLPSLEDIKHFEELYGYLNVDFTYYVPVLVLSIGGRKTEYIYFRYSATFLPNKSWGVFPYNKFNLNSEVNLESEEKLMYGGWNVFQKLSSFEVALLNVAYKLNHPEKVLVYLDPILVSSQVANQINYKFIVYKRYGSTPVNKSTLIEFSVETKVWPPVGISIDSPNLKISHYKEKDFTGADVINL